MNNSSCEQEERPIFDLTNIPSPPNSAARDHRATIPSAPASMSPAPSKPSTPASMSPSLPRNLLQRFPQSQQQQQQSRQDRVALTQYSHLNQPEPTRPSSSFPPSPYLSTLSSHPQPQPSSQHPAPPPPPPSYLALLQECQILQAQNAELQQQFVAQQARVNASSDHTACRTALQMKQLENERLQTRVERVALALERERVSARREVEARERVIGELRRGAGAGAGTTTTSTDPAPAAALGVDDLTKEKKLELENGSLKEEVQRLRRRETGWLQERSGMLAENAKLGEKVEGLKAHIHNRKTQLLEMTEEQAASVTGLRDRVAAELEALKKWSAGDGDQDTQPQERNDVDNEVDDDSDVPIARIKNSRAKQGRVQGAEGDRVTNKCEMPPAHQFNQHQSGTKGAGSASNVNSHNSTKANSNKQGRESNGRFKRKKTR